MACMFNKYFELTSYNNTCESLAVLNVGLDSVSSAVFKKCAKELAPSLVNLFNFGLGQS